MFKFASGYITIAKKTQKSVHCNLYFEINRYKWTHYVIEHEDDSHVAG
mgnify:CR=1 FL=1